MSVHIHIRRLVIDRAHAPNRAAYADAIREALATELARTRPPVPRAAESLDAGTSAPRPEAVGGRIASTLGRVLT